MEKIPSIILSILIVGLIIVIGIFMVGSMGNDLFSDDLVNSSSENILTNYSETLLQTPTTSSATTPKNSWLEFDGVNDFVEVTFNDLNFTNNSNSISLWLNPSISDTAYRDVIFSDWVNREGNFVVHYNSNVLKFEYKNDTTLFSSQYNTLLPNEWNHIIIGVNNTHSLIYINGILEDSDNYNGNVFYNISQLSLGKDSSDYGGSIDEVRIYNQSLSQSQITEIYNSGRIANSSLPSENLVLWYKLNAGEGETAYDSSGNNNHGQ